ncbi:MAG TPA: hypothetical protein DCO75_03215 [Fibrobacteres bacterium]|jgi:hypothetical protein|nr:hypothetical protein [Fibrobacterota bacterium]
MRIWSLHPKYLDTKGLVALWRETLLAKKVLEHKTKGYKEHPQLIRFKASTHPVNAINFYLETVWLEAEKRNYNFDKSKFAEITDIEKLNVNSGQLDFEKNHLLKKLKFRDEKKYNEIIDIVNFETNPLFNLINGGIEPWEKT